MKINTRIVAAVAVTFIAQSASTRAQEKCTGECESVIVSDTVTKNGSGGGIIPTPKKDGN